MPEGPFCQIRAHFYFRFCSVLSLENILFTNKALKK